jgi:cytochrome c oxidase assembly factor CtaG
LYELALHSPGWHAVEHLCFVATALLFWWPVLQPWPSRPQGPRWVLLPYLFLADVQNTILAAFLTFCERVLYPTYATAPRLTALTALDDQAAAGAIMWVLGSVAFLIPAACITIQVLQGPRVAVRPVVPSRQHLPIVRHFLSSKCKQCQWLTYGLSLAKVLTVNGRTQHRGQERDSADDLHD